MNLGNQIHELRKKQHLSQEQLAEKVGVARQTISKWELGETAPDIRQAQILSEVFEVSLDVLLGGDAKKPDCATQDSAKKHASRKKIIAASAALLCLCLVIVGVFGIVKRVRILHPNGGTGSVVITVKDSVRIGKGSADTTVFNENGKPPIACELPERFAADAQSVGLYTDGEGNFVRFHAEDSENVVNPLSGTDYYSWYEAEGYHSYMDMARAAMYQDLPGCGIFSSAEKLYLAGGARLIRAQLCAGRDAVYYAVDGGLTESGDKMRIYGFALHFDDTAWLIILKDWNDIYYYITIKDPNGLGKTIETVTELLSSVRIDG